MAYTIEEVDQFNETWKKRADELGARLLANQQTIDELTQRVVEVEAKLDTARQIKDAQAKLIADLRELLSTAGVPG